MGCTEKQYAQLPTGESDVTEVIGKPGGIQSNFPYHWLDSKHPDKARRRIGDLYWNGWAAFVIGFALSGVGMTFLVLGLGCLVFVEDAPRGFALFFVGVLLSLPGVYSLIVLWYYVCGNKNYSYFQLLVG
ncbi:hypothetical protein TraAM80_03902 [Trypanosoma rangeli]|uniref:Transmembrane protein 230 n=1 Tax=Trypanosoma rangeli TaxID=5698 RepID=A0A3R7KH76_TRYRA|nr:uncharacterized protein TraAM80_03902 [Trypanosoma rangeli]RNF06435.1 hypothetical protein TraAM80_03902 [Trypanosoma rangeli]|eukprot:RNF06435.1 hypothetical protein TraAM80_03902 [Trypanosoma rangeli]